MYNKCVDPRLKTGFDLTTGFSISSYPAVSNFEKSKDVIEVGVTHKCQTEDSTLTRNLERHVSIAMALGIQDRRYSNRTTMPSPIVKSPFLKLDGNLTRGHRFRIHGRREASHQTTKVPPLL